MTDGAAGVIYGVVFAPTAVNCTKVVVDANNNSIKSFCNNSNVNETKGSCVELFDTNPSIESVRITSKPFFLIKKSTFTAVPPCVFSTCGEKVNS